MRLKTCDTPHRAIHCEPYGRKKTRRGGLWRNEMNSDVSLDSGNGSRMSSEASDQAPHIRLVKVLECASQGQGMPPQPPLDMWDQESEPHQSSGILHRWAVSGEPMVIRIGTPLEPSVREACSMCLSALLAVPRSLWTLFRALAKALILPSSCPAKDLH